MPLVHGTETSWHNYIYDFWTFKDLLTHKHSHDNINNDNDDKTVNVENIVKFENSTEIYVEVEELFEDNKS